MLLNYCKTKEYYKSSWPAFLTAIAAILFLSSTLSRKQEDLEVWVNLYPVFSVLHRFHKYAKNSEICDYFVKLEPRVIFNHDSYFPIGNHANILDVGLSIFIIT